MAKCIKTATGAWGGGGASVDLRGDINVLAMSLYAKLEKKLLDSF